MCGIPVHRSSVLSLENVKCEYENKNRGRFIHRKRKRVGVAKRENGSFLFFSRFPRSLSQENLNCQVVEKKKDNAYGEAIRTLKPK